ncbi:MAG: DUF6692 family protein [Pseudomonadota bacterium]
MTRVFVAVLALLAVGACERNVAPSRAPPAQHVKGSQGAPILTAAEAVTRADVTRTDLETLTGADIEKVLAAGPGCRFAYSRTSSPILVVRASGPENAGQAVVKVHGGLVTLRPASDPGFSALRAGAHLMADGLDLTVAPEAEAPAEAPIRDATLRFRLRQGLEVGYRGFYACDAVDGTS